MAAYIYTKTKKKLKQQHFTFPASQGVHKPRTCAFCTLGVR